MEKLRVFFGRSVGLVAPLALAGAFAQTGGGGASFDPSTIASGVTSYINTVAAAGVGVLALTIGLSAAWRYAKKFLKG